MSESTNNGRPVPPAQVSGKGNPATSEKGIVTFSEPQKPQAQVPVYFGYLLCVLGAACITSVPVLGTALVACGVTVVLGRSGFKFGCLASALALAGTAAMGLALDPVSLADALPACVASIGTAYVLSQNKMTPGIGCIIAGLLAMSQLGGAALVAASQGTTLVATIDSVAQEYFSQLATVAGIAQDQLQVIKEILDYLWPLTFTLAALVEFACAYLGVSIASSRLGEKSFEMPKLRDFDLPLWVVAVFVVAVCGLAVATSVSLGFTQLLLMVSLNVIMGLRFAFMIQGLALISAFMRKRELRQFTRVLTFVAAFYLEAQFFVMSIVGLVDVWANFRHLPRGKRITVQDNAK